MPHANVLSNKMSVMLFVVILTHAAASPCAEKVYMIGGDGMGHVLLGAFSCQLLSELDPAVEYTRRPVTKVNCRGSKTMCGSVQCCVSLIDTLEEQYSRSDCAIGLDNCWTQLRPFCDQDANKKHLCDAARVRLSQRWQITLYRFRERYNLRPSHHVDGIIHYRNHPDATWKWKITPINHIRAAWDALEQVNPPTLFSQLTVTSAEVAKAFPNISRVVGGDTFRTWLSFVDARYLFVSASSFSMSAAIMRTQPTLTFSANVHGGRYDWNTRPCRAYNFHVQGPYGVNMCTKLNFKRNDTT